MRDLPLALDRLAEAHAERDRALAIYNAKEAEHGPVSEEAERFAEAAIDPLHHKVDACERAVAEARSVTTRDVLAKVAALAHEGADPEALDRLRADAERLLGLEAGSSRPAGFGRNPLTVDAAAIRARIATFTAEFGAPEPELTVGPDGVVLNDALLDWCLDHGAPLDWLMLGDVVSLLRAERCRWQGRLAVRASTEGETA